jgi:hypothetical protein
VEREHVSHPIVEQEIIFKCVANVAKRHIYHPTRAYQTRLVSFNGREICAKQVIGTTIMNMIYVLPVIGDPIASSVRVGLV